MTSEERHENNTRMRRNSHNRPVRYVRRSSQHHITQIEKKIEVKSEGEDFFLESRRLRNQLRMHYTKEALESSSSSAVKHHDGWIFMSNVMGCQAEICVGRILQSTVATGQKRSRPRTEDIEYNPLDSTQGGKTTGRTDEPR